MLQYSFVCPPETFFDQSIPGCNHITDATVCESAPAFYPLNNKIGTEEDQHSVEDVLAGQDNAPTRRGTRLAEQLERDRQYGNYGNYRTYTFN